MSQPRQIKDGAFCWQHKEKLKMIADIFDATNDGGSARSIYVALTEFASDFGSETFTVKIRKIAERAAVSYSTTARLLNRLELLELIDIQRHRVPGTKERLPSTFTLSGRVVNHKLRLGNSRKRAPFPRRRKETKNKEKETENKGAATAPGNSEPNTPHDSSDSFSSLSLQSQKVPDQARPKDQKEVEDFCISIGLQPSDGEAMWLGWQNQGFGKTRDWKAKIRQWKIYCYHPSQKQQTSNVPKPKPKQPAPSYPQLPDRREPTEKEFADAQRIAREETQKLRLKLRSTN